MLWRCVMHFTFECAHWEGSAHDTRVFQSVLRNPNTNFPSPPPVDIHRVMDF
ncbi:hypothetical protein OROMI_011467 [Orobanche minor]